MGFVLPERRETLVFDEGDYAGAEVVVRMPRNAGLVWQVQRLIDKPDGETADEKRERAAELYGVLASEIVVSWNIEDHRGPIPLTADAISKVDAAFLGELLNLWFLTTTQVSPPKGKPSTASGGAKRRPSRRR